MTTTTMEIASAFQALDQQTAEAATLREAFTAAVGFYDCPCGDGFEFAAGGGIEDYAALNRWLGRHFGRCTI